MTKFTKRVKGKKHKMRRWISGVLAIVLLAIQAPVKVEADYVNKNDNGSVYNLTGKDVAESTTKLQSNLAGAIDIKDFNHADLDQSNDLPESYTLDNLGIFDSEKYYIPEVECQQEGTCSSFSTTYYQFSYEVNRKLGLCYNKLTKEDTRRVYSPYYTYSYISNGGGVSLSENYKSLKERGAVLWDEWKNEICQENLVFDVNKNVCTINNAEIMRNALHTRVNNYYKYYVESGTNANAENISDDERLLIPKALLANNVMLVS